MTVRLLALATPPPSHNKVRNYFNNASQSPQCSSLDCSCQAASYEAIMGWSRKEVVYS